MLERRRGGVINIASEMAYQAMPYFAVGRTYSVLAFSGRLAPRIAVRWMMGRMSRPAVEEGAR
jgi:hypothetical protein